MELDQVDCLKRYFHLGRFQPVYGQRKVDSLMEDYDDVKSLVKEFDAQVFLTLVKTCTQREEARLPRHNEVWFAYAMYLSACERIEERKKACHAFKEVVRSDEDMFTIVHYAWLIQKKNEIKGHSRTIRKALCQWYESKSELDLIEMLEKSRGMYGLTHKDLIVLSHLNMEKVGLANLHSALFKPAVKALQENDSIPTEKWKIPENQEKLRKILELKTCSDPSKACELIEKDKLHLDCVPSLLLRRAEVWQAVLPQLKYRQLLTSMFSLVDLKLFNNRNFCAHFVKAIGNINAMAADQVTPLLMLICAKKLQTKKRYSEKKKASYYSEKVKRNNIKENPLLGSKVTSMFMSSFDHISSKTGLKFFIAINLQASYDKKPVINQTQINCTEAAITLAMTYFRSEPKVEVYTYTPMSTVLEKLNWTAGISFDDAQTVCKTKQSPKNAQRLYAPILEASKKSEAYDVFLIVVPSGARGNPSCKPDKLIQALHEYRKNKKNDRTRIIIVNLRRYTPSMIHGEKKIDNGILEICGFGENIINIINAFAIHSFS